MKWRRFRSVAEVAEPEGPDLEDPVGERDEWESLGRDDELPHGLLELSLMDGFHSVLLLVDHTGSSRRIYWLDQFTRGLSREVTTTLDAEITTFTQTSWQHVLDTKGKRFSTPVRLWRLRRRTP